ncbi:DUF2937 family protein [Loktanella agnita]|uniref:DUF2937 family protein n=1 Tax=Loktanella agnita TaxID=287097 RepID=UPI003988ACE6
MIRVLSLAGAVVGAVSLSQFPEFSQQYQQRLGGQVDALTVEVKAFDASALAAGLGREEALEQIEGTPFLDSHHADERAMFARHARLSDHLMALRAAGPLERLMMPQRFADPDTLRATWAEFAPAVPVSVAGAASAGAGFIGGWLVMAGLLGLIFAPFRRMRRPAHAKDKRREPELRRDAPVARPTLVAETPSHVPRLAGAKR